MNKTAFLLAASLIYTAAVTGKEALLSPKHAAQKRAPVTKAAVVLADSFSPGEHTKIPVLLIQTDGETATNVSSAEALKFTAAKTAGNATAILVSNDLARWQKIRSNAAAIPLEIYDFTYLTQRQLFCMFIVDTTK